ncbi:hypothetical protein ES703_40246 [subsurface metagenome]
MKRAIIFILIVALILLAVPSVMFATKPTDNNASAQKVAWNLSGAVMPVPPYGTLDIPGSDVASKLIVNQPNGNTVVTITGVMKGLNPNTTYTVYLSKGYTKYTPTDVKGTYKWLVLNKYLHDLVITTQNPDGTFSGTGGYPSGNSPYTGPGQTSEIITGHFTGNQITFTTTYSGPYNPGYSATVSGTIAADGTMSGNSPWEWHTTSGNATLASGSKGFPGLFTSTIQPFTFTTDEFGAGNWHINLKDADFSSAGNFDLSVWINVAGRTILISDVFTVVDE